MYSGQNLERNCNSMTIFAQRQKCHETPQKFISKKSGNCAKKRRFFTSSATLCAYNFYVAKLCWEPRVLLESSDSQLSPHISLVCENERKLVENDEKRWRVFFKK